MRTGDLSRPRGLLPTAIVIVTLLLVSACSSDANDTDVVWMPLDPSPTVPFLDTGLVNPQRGQYQDLGIALNPRPTNASGKPWPGTYDVGDRFLWSQIQPASADQFNFSAIDDAIAKAQATNARFHFRIMSFASLGYGGDTVVGVPAWLRATPGATTDRQFEGKTYVVPNWNADSYLAPLEKLIAALGNRYNRDERVQWFEFSGYGDWSENHTGFIATQLGAPGPSPEASMSQLGYYSQYGIQSITAVSITRLVSATLAAFPDTQIITTSNNSEIARQFLAAKPARPVGIRGDCLGVYAPTQFWAYDSQSWYVLNDDPVIPALLARWKVAPIVTEWCNFQPRGTSDYFQQAIRDTVNYHVSLVASNAMPRPPELQDMWGRTNKYAGYRYAVTSKSTPGSTIAGSDLSIKLHWINFGVAPTYDDWQIEYQIHDSAGKVLATTPSALSLRSIASEQDYSDTSRDPASASRDDSASFTTTHLPPGQYTVAAKVVWQQHKPNGTNVINYPPMILAQIGRDETGAYPVAKFELF